MTVCGQRALVLALALVASCLVGPAPAARADGGQSLAGPTAVSQEEPSVDPARIRGRVVDPHGTPLAGITVGAYLNTRPRLMGAVCTDADGVFELLVDPGTWRVGFTPHSDDLLYEFYRDADTYYDGTTVRVGTDDVDLGTVTMSGGGSLAGTVLDATGTPLPGAKVTIVRGDIAVDWDETDAAGRYRADALRAGDYTVYVEHADHAPEFVDNRPTLDTAVRLPVSSDDDTPVEFPPVQLVARTAADPPMGYQLTGIVRGTDGRPVPGVSVYAYAGPYDGTSDQWTVTDENGRYKFQSLSYYRWTRWKLFFYGGHRAEPEIRYTWHGGGTSYETAPWISIPPVGSTTIDQTVRMYGGISGTITAAEPGNELNYAYAVVYDEHGAFVEYIDERDMDGTTYFFRRLEPGRSYFVEMGGDVDDHTGSDGETHPVWWESGSTLDDATPISVTERGTRRDVSARLVEDDVPATPDPPPGPDPEPTPDPDPEPTPAPEPTPVPEPGHVPLEPTTPGHVTGRPVVGGTLVVQSGTWSLAPGVHETVEWRARGTVVGAGRTLRLGPRLAGATLRARVTAIHEPTGQRSVVSLDPVTVARTGSVLTVRPDPRRGGVGLMVRVSSRGPLIPTPSGLVVRERGRVLVTKAVGRAVNHLVLPLRPGRHVLVVRYRGSPAVAPSETKVVVRVPKRPAGRAVS